MKLSLPHDAHAERAVLGAVLIDPAQCWPVASELLRGSDFHDLRHSAIWAACKSLMEQTGAVDFVLLHGRLESQGTLAQVGGDEYLLSLTEVIPTTENTRRVALRIRELSLLREVVRTALQLADEGSQPVADVPAFLDRASTALSKVCERKASGLAVTTLSDALLEAYERLAARQQSGQSLLGHPTGFVDLDRALSGFAPGDLIVLAARPGMGKTALANELKLGIARSTGLPVFSLELEMSREQLAHRMLATASGVDLRRIRSARLDVSDMSLLAASADELSRLPIVFIERRDTRMSDLRVAARKHVREHGPLGLVVVDYLQIAKAENRASNREREVAEISGALKSLAGELQCPVLALSQLNRGVESRAGADRRPRLSDLRESGAIEQDADTVLLLHREEVYNPGTADKGVAELIISKQRSGGIGVVRLRWVAELTRFESLSRSEQQVTQEHFEYEQQGNGSNGHFATGRHRA